MAPEVPPPKITHDRALFDALVAALRPQASDLRTGAMFGAPAAYAGKRMAFCVFGSAIGAKLPAEEAARLVASGTAVWFRPYGRKPMREWVELSAKTWDVAHIVPVLAIAVRYANATS